MIYTAGEMLAEFVSHEIGCKLEKTTEFSGPYPSGAPAIFIDQVSRIGGKAAVIGTVGGDPFGRMLRTRLMTDGVDTTHLATNSEKTTGTAFVSYSRDGDRDFVFHINDTAADDVSTVPRLPKGSTLHISGASLGNHKIRSLVENLVDQVSDSGIISYDPNIRPELIKSPEVGSFIKQIIDVCDIFLPSDTDIQALFPDLNPIAVIDKMLAKGKKIVVVKQGAKGVIGSNGQEIHNHPPCKVNEVDPTGAGDCFCGTLLGCLDQEMPFQEALTAANAAGALHVTQRGPMEWNPTLAEIQGFLGEQI